MTKLKKFLEHVLILTLSFSSTLAYSSKNEFYYPDSFSPTILNIQSQQGISYVNPPIGTFQTGISLLGYYIDEDSRRFVTFWDYNSLNNSDKKRALEIKEVALSLNSHNDYYDWKYDTWWEAARNFISPFTGGCDSYSSMYSKTGFMYYSLEISAQLYYCDTRYTTPSRERANEVLKPDRETFDQIFGKSLNTTLRNNGQKINYFLTHTNNLKDFAKGYVEDKFVHIQVVNIEEGSYDFKRYLEGLNLFMRTLVKENKSSSYGLESSHSKGKKQGLFKNSKENKNSNDQTFILIEKSKSGSVSRKDASLTYFRVNDDPFIASVLEIEIESDQRTVTYLCKGKDYGVKSLKRKIQIELEKTFGGNWELKKERLMTRSRYKLTFSKK